jgi:hypothetical protein
MRKSTARAEAFAKCHPVRRVKSRYGEPKHWDGFTTLFVLIIRQELAGVTPLGSGMVQRVDRIARGRED